MERTLQRKGRYRQHVKRYWRYAQLGCNGQRRHGGQFMQNDCNECYNASRIKSQLRITKTIPA
jgi:hypothetical protein